MKFRFHKGSLEDSIKTVIDVNSLEELEDIISKEYDIPLSGWFEFRFEYAGYDNRIDWETYYVIVKDMIYGYGYIAGMINGVFKKEYEGV